MSLFKAITFRAFSNGAPLSGGKVYFYANGTGTPQSTYADFARTTAADNPLTTNSNGEVTTYLDPALLYTVRVETSDGTLVDTEDNVSGAGTFYEQSSSETSGGVTPTNYNFEPGHIGRYLPAGHVTDGTVAYTSGAQDWLDANAGGYAFIPPDYTVMIDDTIEATSALCIGGGGTIKADATIIETNLATDDTEGLIKLSANQCKIDGLIIDMDGKCRNVIQVDNAECEIRNVTVVDMQRGASGSFGDSEAAVRVRASDVLVDGVIVRNQTTATASSSPRCVSVQNNADNTVVRNITGETVNAGVIVGSSTRTYVDGFKFSTTSDNGIYCIDGCEQVSIRNGIIDDSEEPIVVAKAVDIEVKDVTIVNSNNSMGLENSVNVLFDRITWLYTEAATIEPAIFRTRSGNSTFVTQDDVTATWISDSSFSMTGNVVKRFPVNRPIQLVAATSGTNNTTISAVTYNGTITTVTLASAILDASTEAITSVDLAGSHNVMLRDWRVDCRFPSALTPKVIAFDNGVINQFWQQDCHFIVRIVDDSTIGATSSLMSWGATASDAVHIKGNYWQIINETDGDLTGEAYRFTLPTGLTDWSEWENNRLDASQAGLAVIYVTSAGQQYLTVRNAVYEQASNRLREDDIITTNGRQDGIYVTAAPTAGYHPAGALFIKEDAVPGESFGFFTTTAGTPGTQTLLPNLNLEGSAAATDLGSIPDGDEEAVEVTVTGAALGDYALASHSLDVQDLTVSASVTAADTVTVIFANNTGGAIDIASGTVRAKVFKR